MERNYTNIYKINYTLIYENKKGILEGYGRSIKRYKND